MDEVAGNAAPEAAPPTLGEMLARGREEQGLTRNDVAQRLHMSPSQIEALEGGDYARLPKGTFLRGFVRNYAKVVGIDPESVLPLLAEGAPTHPAPGIVVPSQNIRFDPLGERFNGPWVKAGATAIVVIALAFAGMYWWLFVRPQPPAQRVAHAPATAASQVSTQRSTPALPSAPPAAPTPAPATPATAPSPAPANTAMASTAMPSGASGANASPPSAPSPAGAAAKGTESKAVETKGADTKAASAATPATGQATQVAANNPAPAKGDRRLHFTFKGESWVEVRDASGRVVFRQLNPAGSEASVSGKPPLQVVVGNAEEVELEKDGKPFDLAPATDTDVARFKVE